MGVARLQTHGVDDDDNEDDDDDDEDVRINPFDENSAAEDGDISHVVGRPKLYRSAFDPVEVRGVQRTCPITRGFLLPRAGDARSHFPAALNVVGDRRYAKLQSNLSVKAAQECESVYNVAAWVQRLHNREPEREEATAHAKGPASG